MSPKPQLKVELPPEFVREGMELSAGRCSDQNEDPRYFECVTKKIDPENRELVLFFDSTEEFEKCKKIWIGAKAPGFAFWETHLSVSSRSTHDQLIVRPEFPEGFSIRGRIDAGSVQKEQVKDNRIRVKAIPASDTASVPSQRVVMETQEAEVDAQGNFKLKNALPGRYFLEIDGCIPTTYQKDIVVAESDLNLGDIEIKQFGTLRGSIDFLTKEQDDFAFTKCEISYYPTWFESLFAQFFGEKPAPWKPFEVMTDENGEFVAENVPAGDVQVTVTQFMRFSRTAVTTVRNGKTSKVVIEK